MLARWNACAALTDTVQVATCPHISGVYHAQNESSLARKRTAVARAQEGPNWHVHGSRRDRAGKITVLSTAAKAALCNIHRHKRQSASTARLGAAAALMATVGLRVTGGCSCCRCPAGTVLGTVTAICSLLRTALLFKTRAEQQGVEDCYFYDVSFINLATVLQVGPILCAEAMIEMRMLTNMTAFDAVYPEESIAHKGY